MTFRARQPGCACCEQQCLITEEQFGSQAALFRFDVDPAESLTVADHIASITASSARAILDIEHPSPPYPTWYRIRFRGTDGAVLRFFVAWDETTNTGATLEIKVDADCSTFHIVENLDIDPVPIPFIKPGTWYNLQVCWDPDTGEVRATIQQNTSLFEGIAHSATAVWAAGSLPGRRVGFGTGTTHIGTADFDDLIFSRLWYYEDGSYGSDKIECTSCILPCSIIRDIFMRAEIGCTWSIKSGTWALASGGYLSCTSDGLIIQEVPHPIPGSSVHIEVEVRGASDGDRLRVIVDYYNPDNYHFAELTVGEFASLRIYRREGGVNTQLGSSQIVSAPVNQFPYTLYVCKQSGSIRANLHQDGITRLTTMFGGNKVGLEASITNAAYFSQFRFSRHQSDDSDCPSCVITATCVNCVGDQAPSMYKTVLSGFHNTTPVNCSNCEVRNGTFLTPARPPEFGTSFPCQWRASGLNHGIGGMCPGQQEDVIFISVNENTTDPDLPPYFVHVGVAVSNFGGFTFRKHYQSKPNCDTFVDEDIPYTGETWHQGSPRCAVTNPSCKLTAT